MLKKIFTLNSRSKKLIVVMFFVSLVSLTIAYFYYGSINAYKDPRVTHIGDLYKKYNLYVSKNNFQQVLNILGQIESEYQKIEHYKDSYEVGVVNTNRAAVYLTMALYHAKDQQQKRRLLHIAEKNLKAALNYYRMWQQKYQRISKNKLYDYVAKDFTDIKQDRQKIIKIRADEINLALSEIKKRNSVSYANLGIIKRHQLKQDEAIIYYKKAIENWDDNFAAKSNLSVLMGKEPLKRGLLDRLFPPKKK